MEKYFAYWRTDLNRRQVVLYGFPRPGQEPPVLGRVVLESDCPEARQILIEKVEKELEGEILIVE